MGIEIVMLGWNHADWCGTYYPQDLPQDWQLAFFATKFEGVILPAQTWQATPSELLQQWADDVPERFHFYLEDLPGDTAGIFDRAAAALGERYAGRVANLPPVQAPGHPDPTIRSLQAPPFSAIDADGLPMLARLIPDCILADSRSTLSWLQAFAAEAGQRPALAILAEAPVDTLSSLVQLVQLAELA